MYYEINISLKGQHFFATARRSITDQYKLQNVYKTLKEKFSEDEGYEFRVTKWEEKGQDLTSELIKTNELINSLVIGEEYAVRTFVAGTGYVWTKKELKEKNDQNLVFFKSNFSEDTVTVINSEVLESVSLIEGK